MALPTYFITGMTSSSEMTDIKLERQQSTISHDGDAKSHDDAQRMPSLNLAEFLSQLEDYTPTVSELNYWKVYLNLLCYKMNLLCKMCSVLFQIGTDLDRSSSCLFPEGMVIVDIRERLRKVIFVFT